MDTKRILTNISEIDTCDTLLVAGNTLSDRVIVPSRKCLIDNSAVGVFDIALPSNSTTGGTVQYTIHVTDGTDFQVHSGMLVYGGVNKAGTITSNFGHATAGSGLELDVNSAGTISDTWSVVNGASKITLTLNANSSLTTPTIWIEYTIYNNSASSISQL